MRPRVEPTNTRYCVFDETSRSVATGPVARLVEQDAGETEIADRRTQLARREQRVERIAAAVARVRVLFAHDRRWRRERVRLRPDGQGRTFCPSTSRYLDAPRRPTVETTAVGREGPSGRCSASTCAVAAFAALCAAAFAAAKGSLCERRRCEAGDDHRRSENRRESAHGMPTLPPGAPFGGACATYV